MKEALTRLQAKHTVEVTTHGNVKVDQVTISAAKIDVLQSFIFNYADTCFPEIKSKTSQEQITWVKSLLNHIIEVSKKSKIQLKKYDNLNYLADYMDNFILMSDYKVKGRKLMVTSDKCRPTALDPGVYLEQFTPAQRQKVLHESPFGEIVYNPFNLEPYTVRFDETARLPVTSINLYEPLEWQLVESFKQEIPELINRFLTHLFPIPEQKIYVLNWLHHAITMKNETYLILHGDRGIGKTIFTRIAAALIGNSAIAPMGFLTSNFNGFIAKKRLIIIDEGSINRVEADVWKRYAGDKLMLQEKHVPFGSDEKLFANFILCNNPTDTVYARQDERRYSPPDLTQVSATKVFSQEELHYLSQGFENDLEALANFGQYILSLRDKLIFGSHLPLKTNTFWKLVIESLPGFHRFLVEKILEGTKTRQRYTSLIEEYKKLEYNANIPSGSKTKTFLETFRIKDNTQPIGALIKDDNKNKWILTVSKEYATDSPEDDCCEVEV